MAERDILIVGGGITGLAIAYQLGKLGLGPRVRLVERHTLAAAATSRAAALVTLVRSKTHFIPLVWETYRAIDELQSEFGQDVGLRRVGALHVGSVAVAEELRVQAEAASGFGIASVPLGPAGAATLAPWLDPEALGAAMFYPQEAFVEPYLLATAYGRAAVALGVEVRQGVTVSALRLEGGRVAGVHLGLRTAPGCDHDRAALRERPVARALVRASARITVRARAKPTAKYCPPPSPSWPAVPGPGCSRPPWATPCPWPRCAASTGSPRPTIFSPGRAPSSSCPRRRPMPGPRWAGCSSGCARKPRRWLIRTSCRRTWRASASTRPIPDGWDNLAAGAPALRPFFPALDRLGIAHYITGPSNYTPDGNLIVGAFPDLPGLLVAAGCNGAGIATSGGVGRLVAELTAGRPTFVDPAPHRPERFGHGDFFAREFMARCAAARSGKRSG